MILQLFQNVHFAEIVRSLEFFALALQTAHEQLLVVSGGVGLIDALVHRGGQHGAATIG